MGAGNVAAAFQLYAGKVPPTSMQVLLYMAVVSKDSDDSPWFSQGREALAEYALGRPGPFDRADARAVERAIEPLFTAGAIETQRRASVRRDGSSTAKYRLNLSPADGLRKTWGEKKRDARREDGSRPTKSAHHAPRNSSSRPTDSVLTPHEIRGPEEKEDLSRSEEEEEMADLQTTSHPPREAAPIKSSSVVSIFRRTDQAQATLDASAANRRKAEADHRARLASGETS